MDDAIRQLNRAALDPRQSVVIEACAGSGKTWLLVSRIVRLLLSDVRPSEILAITFTRKAAQEMQSRLHDWLHLLATAEDRQVLDFLRDREVPEREFQALLPRARSLLERFLTDRPGITVSTFHGWFLHLLKHAPLASGAAGGANLADQTSALIEEAWQQFAEGLQRNPQSPVARALTFLFETYGLENTRSLLVGFLDKRAEWWAYTREQPDGVVWALDRLRAGMPVAPDADVIGELFGDGARVSHLDEYAALLDRNATQESKRFAQLIRGSLADASLDERFARVCGTLLTAAGTVRVRNPSAAQEQRLGAEGQRRFLELHEELAREFLEARAWLTEQQIYRLNEAALLCGTELLDRYQRIKTDRGLIDYTDVEWRASLLLNHSHYAEYMQYKLDARYRHVLLDEFQDTNPLQWRVMKAWLEASVAAGNPPTVFQVGDPKQSIYRFRRAEPRLFAIAGQWLKDRHGAVMLDQNVTRRNAPAVASVVNRVFEGRLQNFHPHVSYQQALPGTVEVLPLIDREPSPQAEPQPWRNPLRAARADAVDRRRELEAARLATGIRDIVGRWQVIDNGVPRRARHSDIMVLVTRRTHLEIYERALRHAQVPYVSGRQGGLLDTREADDLTALLHFLVIPFADLHLAVALRSPVFSATDDDLQALAAAGGRTWWLRLERLVEGGGAGARLERAHALLKGWLQWVDTLPVHDLLDRIYFEGDVMRRYEAAVPAPMRMGVAANLRAFLEVALTSDSGRYPSLQGFLHRIADMRRSRPEEAPDAGAIAEGADAVRILTVHGAKGLESPVVWLLDANATDPRADGYGALVDWPPEADAPAHFSMVSRKAERGLSRALLFEREERLAAREDLNLLYVAMTRAKQALIVSGCEGHGADDSWYQRIREAVQVAGVAGLRLPDETAAEEAAHSAPPAERLPPEEMRRPLSIGERTDRLVDPRRRYGTLLHALLERLVPPGEGGDRDFLRQALGVSGPDFDRLWQDAQSLLRAPDLGRFFDPAQYLKAYNELAYVSASGELRRIDRVVEFEREIWVLDYKTGETADPDDLAAAARPYRAQLAGYRAAIRGFFPGKAVHAALLFSGGLIHVDRE
jgi:ATP-dependent helicase/nuclease subunit A